MQWRITYQPADQGREWKGEFAALLVDAYALIDHHQTPASHKPMAWQNAQCKREKCMNTSHSGGKEWDWDLPYVMLGYNCVGQISTKVRPYSIIHVVEPTIPTGDPRFEGFMDLDNSKLAAVPILQCSASLQRSTTMAGGNLLMAQHRDTWRYTRMWGGGTLLVLRCFDVGDSVYQRYNGTWTSLDAKTKPKI